ncbi:agmatine deiminase family protein, partial [Pseudoalteromonas sp. SIMBA_153]
MSILLTDSTPQQDGFYMPAEFEPIQKVWMVWPYRADNWRQQAIPAKKAYA